MHDGKTGTQTNIIINANNVSRIKCDCASCFHSVKGKNIKLYCKYYCIENPSRKTCARYSYLDKSKDKITKEDLTKCKIQKSAPVFPWEHS